MRLQCSIRQLHFDGKITYGELRYLQTKFNGNELYQKFHFEEIAEVTVIRDQVVKMEKFMVTTPAWINYVLIRSIVEKQYDLITGTEVCIRALNDEVTRTTHERPSDLECKISNIAADISTFTLALGSKLAIVNMMNKCLKQKGEPLVHYALVSPKSKVVATTYPGIAIHVEELQSK